MFPGQQGFPQHNLSLRMQHLEECRFSHPVPNLPLVCAGLTSSPAHRAPPAIITLQNSRFLQSTLASRTTQASLILFLSNRLHVFVSVGTCFMFTEFSRAPRHIFIVIYSTPWCFMAGRSLRIFNLQHYLKQNYLVHF